MAVSTIPGRWLRNIKDGTVYAYSELLAGNPMVVEVSEEQAFPEKHVPERQRGRVGVVDLSGADAPEEPLKSNEALSEELTRDIEKMATKGGRKK